MHPSVHAKAAPEKAAVIMCNSGVTVSYKDLDERSNQVAHLFRSLGVKASERVALMMENNARYHEISWGAQRSGLHFVCISTQLTATEAAYLIQDSGAKVLIISNTLAVIAEALVPLVTNVTLLMANGTIKSYDSFVAARDKQPRTPIADESSGHYLLYSSGTTGRQKGVQRKLGQGPIDEPDVFTLLQRDLYDMGPESVYLCPGPLYHAAPLGFSLSVHRLGGTVVVMEKFDAEAALMALEKYNITDAQFVPTHFIRMLKLPESIRKAYDRPRLKCVIHAAAPCPIPVKQAMIDWWGPMIYEYYAGSEGNGMTMITSAEWLTHKGSVGKPIFGKVHICDDAGHEVPPRTEGTIYFEGGLPIIYHNDPQKTADAYNRMGWSTIGDVGWVDEDGYLYLTDRKHFMIITGGVNVYPQEVENLLVTHPKVADVAVIGAPDSDFGERVVAVVQPMNWEDAGETLRNELLVFARASLSSIKTPKQIDFRKDLPRNAIGKLVKRLLRDEYWKGAAPSAS